MIKLKKVAINKYKSIETSQSFEVEDDITILVGKNEAGKTAILEAIAKSNYFIADPKFKYEANSDYPRKEKKAYDKAGLDVNVIECTFEISNYLLREIQKDVGSKTFTASEFSRISSYRSEKTQSVGIRANAVAFLEHFIRQHAISDKDLELAIKGIKATADIEKAISEASDNEAKTVLTKLKEYYKNDWKWTDPISEYIARVWILPRAPKFLYYDEYYGLPSEIDLNKLNKKQLEEDSLKTSKALFELADINIQQLLGDEDYEPYKAELEATGAAITATMFKYWKTNANLRLQFDIQKNVNTDVKPPQITPILKIRVWNDKYQMSLPLASRSKGFNWFCSFIVWFSKIQEDKSSQYILLLDEPGLNLHATAQEDLLRYLEDLSGDYQVIYTTHSPFMVATDHLHRIRTVFEGETGTTVSNSIQEKDPDTLFPLQAALGYDIAQNLFIGKNNLLIEGVSDLIYLTVMSEVLKKSGRTGLDENITLVPVGGLDKVSTFISLLRGQKLKIACLLDTFTDPKGKARLDDLIFHKLIKATQVRFFDEFAAIPGKTADLEDLFEKEDFLKIFNPAFKEYKDLAVTDLPTTENRIIAQINLVLGIQRFNHYRPANYLATIGTDAAFFKTDTLDHFESAFKVVNKLFK